jgi:hypothetical protein
VWLGQKEATTYFSERERELSDFLKRAKDIVDKHTPEDGEDSFQIRSDRYTRVINDIRGELIDFDLCISAWLVANEI